MKLLILGYGRHGKDTLAEVWRDYFGLTFKSSSMAAVEIFLFDALKDIYGYQTIEDCYNDRMNHRTEWYQRIKEYNTPNLTRLAREILKDNDCYVGMRDRDEVLQSHTEGLFDLIVWVDASRRLPPESTQSCTVTMDDAHFVIPNNGTRVEFVERAVDIGSIIFNK